ncbi:pyridoxal phosphate-dependent transferase [Cyathus striatus]|nr:pyridoxal phosphate-dependent transferase [Cyathus striatus]
MKAVILGSKPPTSIGRVAHSATHSGVAAVGLKAISHPLDKPQPLSSRIDPVCHHRQQGSPAPPLPLLIIGAIVILGSTYTGHFENVKLMNDLLNDLLNRTGLDIPIHVDAASGGFITPFVYPSLKWSFDVARVVSINTSSHKFGLRDEKFLHKELVFELHYLGSTEYTFTLNFSKPDSPIIAQMFNFLNLGFDGYKSIATKDLRNARMLSCALEHTYFTILSNIHRPVEHSAVADVKHLVRDVDNPELYGAGLPVVSFKLLDELKKEYPHVQQAWIQSTLRMKGWAVPNYNAPKGEEKTEILRVVVRETLTKDLTERLIVDILEITESLLVNRPSQHYNHMI